MLSDLIFAFVLIVDLVYCQSFIVVVAVVVVIIIIIIIIIITFVQRNESSPQLYSKVFFLLIDFLFQQIVIVEFFHTAFHVEGMDLYQWMWCFFLGFSELIWAQIIFTIPKDVLPEAFRCIAVGAPKGRGIAYYRSSSRVEQQVLSHVLLQMT